MDRRLAAIIAFGAALAVVVGVVLIAQGGGESDDGEDPCEATTAGELGSKPEISVTGGAAPDELVSEDIEAGDGTAAAKGDTLTVHYVGVDCDTGEEFDASWGGEPFELTLGAGEVIPGWDEGLEGMKEGGRRQLIIPPELAYGPEGQPPAIGPNATLVFAIDLEKVG